MSYPIFGKYSSSQLGDEVVVSGAFRQSVTKSVNPTVQDMQIMEGFWLSEPVPEEGPMS